MGRARPPPPTRDVAPEVAVRADERAPALRRRAAAPKLVSAPTANDLVAVDDAVVADLDAVLEHDPRARRRSCARRAARPRRSTRLRGDTRRELLVRGERPEGIRVGAERLEEAPIEHALRSRRARARPGGVTPSSEMPAKSPVAAATSLRSHEPLDVLGGDEAVLLDRTRGRCRAPPRARPPAVSRSPARRRCGGRRASRDAPTAAAASSASLSATTRDAAAELDLVPCA